MSIFGNNIIAFITLGSVIFVEEPTAEQVGETVFEDRAISVVDDFLDEFGIDGIYQPGSLNRPIRAIMKYKEDAATVDPMHRHRSPILTMKVPNCETEGITASESKSSQTVIVPPRKGADARLFHIARIFKQSAAWVTYEIH